MARSGGDARRQRRRRGRVAAWLSAACIALPLVLAGPAAASHSSCPQWGDGRTAYPYPFHGGLGAEPVHALPACRVGIAGTGDRGTHALEPARINMRREIAGLRPNPLSGQVRWTLVDSLGRPLAVLARTADGWETTDWLSGRRIYRSYTLRSDQLTVQGRGCMAADLLESQYALVAFAAREPNSVPAGVSRVPYQIRAFLPRAALPARDAAGRPLPRVDDYDTGCGDARLELAAERVPDPRFDSERDQFYATNGRANTYATYNVKAPYGNARYVTINTTGVYGGGIVRAVVRLEDVVSRTDAFGYCDPNVASTRATPAASWAHGTVTGTRIAGWFARRC